MPDERMEKLCQLNGAANILGVPFRWLMDECEAGRLPGMVLGGSWYCRPADVQAVIDGLYESARAEWAKSPAATALVNQWQTAGSAAEK
jgi:hypothetical protein